MKQETITIDDIIKQLKLFSEEMIDWFPPAEPDKIAAFEEKIKAKLPQDFIDFLMISNGLSLGELVIIGHANQKLSYGLERIYHFEHKMVDEIMPSALVPFQPDGEGNHYCINTKDNTVVFWDYANETYHIVNNSFTEYMQYGFIDKVLEKYDHQGNEK